MRARLRFSSRKSPETITPQTLVTDARAEALSEIRSASRRDDGGRDQSAAGVSCHRCPGRTLHIFPAAHAGSAGRGEWNRGNRSGKPHRPGSRTAAAPWLMERVRSACKEAGDAVKSMQYRQAAEEARLYPRRQTCLRGIRRAGHRLSCRNPVHRMGVGTAAGTSPLSGEVIVYMGQRRQ